MLEKCTNNPQVTTGGSFELKDRQVTRFDCESCGRCALVPNMELGTDLMKGQLERGGFCDSAIQVSIVNVCTSAVLSGTDSVVQ